MVRLTAVRASIAALKRALSLSNRLKPSTWELLAIFSAALFVLSVWSFRESQQPRVPRGGNSLAPQIAEFSLDRIELAHFSLRVAEIAGPDDDNLYSIIVDNSWSSAPASTIKPWMLIQGYSHTAFAWGGIDSTESTAFARRESALDLRGLWRSFRQAPTVIYQPASEGGTSSGKELVYWVQIFGILFTALMAFTAQTMMWIGLHRKRVEGTLLLLDIEKRRLEIEHLKITLEQARSKSG